VSRNSKLTAQNSRLLFERFVERKTREAERAVIPPLVTIDDHSGGRPLDRIGSAWTRRLYDGDFHLIEPPPGLPAVSMVFVQSRDGNTAADNPGDLGGGPTDTYLIYEGLSRVAADAVLAGAATVAGSDVFFSVWHPEIVALRRDLGLPRHPAQMVISKDGRVDLDSLFFNVPDVPVFVLAGEQCRNRCVATLAVRPWITVVPISPSGLVDTFAQLRLAHGLSRISLVGGRSTASAMIDAGLVQDLCLTTTAQPGGRPDTPFYTGKRRPTFETIVRKRGTSGSSAILFEHSLIRASAPSS
jgi:riboflavin biosynthesis pyrimidine reductase